jgi:hypothetical protein
MSPALSRSSETEPFGAGLLAAPAPLSFMADLVHRDAGIAARLPFCAMRSLGFGTGPA